MFAGELHLAVGRIQQPAQNLDDRGLAGSVRPRSPNISPYLNLQAETLDRRERSELHVQIFCADRDVAAQILVFMPAGKRLRVYLFA